MMLVDASRCTGCGACAKACPKQAIVFQDDHEGFPTPVILQDQCVECGLCNKVCPAINMPQTHEIQQAYAVQLLDKEALKDSTSGGVFTVLSREIFRRGGVVYGCVWDENYNAVIRCAHNEEEMKPMRGSKYVWSWAGDTYPEIKQQLEAGQTVMFTGLPCQVAGLRNYLRRDYENLFTLDFLCSGTPSPMAFQKYLDTICKPGMKRSELNLKFRDKNPYGLGVHITYKGRKAKKTSDHISNPYYYSFYTRLVDRNSCFQCPYGTEQRVADLTMGDYWGVAKFHTEFDINSGVSAILINSERGNVLLQTVSEQMQIVPTRAADIAAGNNLSLGNKRKTIKVAPFREQFFQTVKTKGWKAAEYRYLLTKPRVKVIIKDGIKRMIPSNVKVILKKVLKRKG